MQVMRDADLASGRRQPLRALAAQGLGLVVSLALAWGVPGWFPGWWQLALLQGIVAALSSRVLQQPPWWWPMHLLFLPAVLGALALQLPSGIYLGVFMLLALVFWGTVQGDVPLFLSSPTVAAALAELAEQERAGMCADLGAGVGSVVVPLAQRLPLVAIEAWERAPLPWAIAEWRCRRVPNVAVRRASFWNCHFARYDLVFAFLSPAVMPALGEKIRREMRPGSLFVSSSFAVPGWIPEAVQNLDDRRGTLLYCYRIEGATP